jgi:hypothetical protein
VPLAREPSALVLRAIQDNSTVGVVISAISADRFWSVIPWSRPTIRDHFNIMAK